MNGALPKSISALNEMMAIGWSYSAAVYLNISPFVVFHENGYKGGGKNLVAAFEAGTPSLPMLQWHEMAYDAKQAAINNKKPFPQCNHGHTR
jgi:hypothetical protein